MNIEEYRNYCINKRGVTESFPFGKLPDILVFKVQGKMFTATDVSTFKSIRVKCRPDMVDKLRDTYQSVTTQPYMHKKHWNSIIMDNSISNDLIFQWIDDSYNLVVANLSKKEKDQLK